MDDNRASLYIDSDKAKILDCMNEPYQERLYYILDGERRYVECDGNDYFNYLIGKISDSSVYNQYEIDLRYTYKEGNKRYFSYGNTKREVTVYTVQKKLYRDGNYFYIYNLYPVYYSSNTAFHWSTQQVKAYLFKERQYGNDSNKIVVSESSIPEDLLAIDQEIAEIDDYLFQLTETKEDYKRQTSVNELKETYNALSVDIISISQSIETSALNKEKELLDRQIALTNDAISAEEKGILEQYKYDLQYYQGQVNKFESQAAKAKDGSKKEGRKEAKVEKNQAEYDRILKEQNNEIAKATASYILNNDNAYFQIEMNREKRELAMKQNELNIIKMAIDAQLNTDAQNQLQKDILDVQDTIDKTDEIRKYKEGIRAKLITIEKQKPMDYIVAENDWALGFDYYGRMVAVIDNYENSTIVMYKDDNIDYVITSDELVMQFLYNGDGRLSKIIDHKYRETQYEYDTDGRLIRIIYPDNTAEKGGNGEYPLGASVSNFKYYTDNNSLKNNLKEIVDQSGYAVQLAYPTNQVTVQDGTYATGIDKFEITPNEVNGAAQFNAGKLTTVKFQNNWSARVEGDAGATTYVFDNIGRVMSKYEDGTYLDNNYISVTNAIASAYNGKQRSYSVSVDENKENYILNPSFDNAASWQYSAGISITSGAYAYGSTALRLSADPMAQRFIFQPISQAASPVKFAAIGNKKNLVLSLWAKADSAYIVSDRRTGYEDTMLVSHTDGYDISKRKFEIKATAAYASGAPDIFTVSFDWLNTEWQLATLPIRLDKERNLSSIEVRFDYSYNVNDVCVDNFRLSEGEGEYCEYYPDGKLKFVTDGTTESHYKYNGIASPSEAVQIDADGNKATTKYTYNYQGSLIRSEDWSGIVAECEYDDKGHEIKSVTYHKDDRPYEQILFGGQA
jgi:YD repeat-containing protein